MRLLVENFHSACQSILHERASPALNYAVGYARAGLSMTDPREVQVQCLYILNNIIHWRGETAKRCRETFKRQCQARKLEGGRVMQLNIYHLARLGVTRYDEASAFVVIAASQDEARRMASDDAGDEGAYTWVDPVDSSCEVIGTALPDAVPGPVVRSFHAG